MLLFLTLLLLTLFVIVKSKFINIIKNFTHNDNNLFNPISLEYGLDTMLVIAAAHKSFKTGKAITIDYTLGYNNKALK